jgi:type II secretory pathway pseudopilin PulG
MIKIQCCCLFDITATGVNSHTKPQLYPATTKKGHTVNNEIEFGRARNQQRNFDTLLQLISLRTQIFNVTDPEVCNNCPGFTDQKAWCFTFEIEPQWQWAVDGKKFWLLNNDSDGTPMITGLTETATVTPCICSTGNTINTIYYEI